MSGTFKVFLLLAVLALLGIAVFSHRTQPAIAIHSPAKSILQPIKGNEPVILPDVSGTNAAADGNHQLPNLSHSILLILDDQADNRARIAAARESLARMSDADRQALYVFLLQPIQSDKDQQGQFLKNLVLDQLCVLHPSPTGLGALLAQLYDDRNQNVVLRDYAVQHMVNFCEQMQPATDNSQPDKQNELSRIQDVLWEALNETNSSIAGTALLGLQQLSEEQPGFDQNRISAKALQLAGDDGVGQMTRITAIQVCALNGLKESIPLLKQVASQSQSIPMRISAIGAIGSLGGSDQAPFLASLLDGKEDRLTLPVQQALNRLKQ